MNSIRHALAIGVAAALVAACGGGGGSTEAVQPDPEPGARQLLLDQTIAGYPHKVDVYVPEGTPSRVVIFLHGGLGTKERFAHNMGITPSDDPATMNTVNWTWLQQRGTVAVVPQGQGAGGRGPATWGNYVMESGQDDVGFLKAVAARVRTDYGNVPISVVGHSNGAMMVNRLWCEAADTFNVFVAFAGPGSQELAGTQCSPSRFRPYLGYVGSEDTTINSASAAWTASRWEIRFDNGLTVLDPLLVSEWTQFLARIGPMCGESRVLADGTTSGGVTTWTACGGRVRVQEAAGLDHSLGVPDNANPTVLSDRALDFIQTQESN